MFRLFLAQNIFIEKCHFTNRFDMKRLPTKRDLWLDGFFRS